MNNFYKLLQKYDYSFPKELIANAPASPRDSAKLLIYERKSHSISLDVYKNIHKYLSPGSHLVFNQTKVVPARLTVKKPTGGKAKLLFIDHDSKHIKVISDRKLVVGSRLKLGRETLKVKKQANNFYFLEPSFPTKKIYQVLAHYGATPIPPYIKNSPLPERKLRQVYQTVFAKTSGSVAAPTASLHFTKALLKKLQAKGVQIHFITLHVNMGTFAPLTESSVKTGKLHTEYYEIDKKTAAALNRAKKRKEKIIGIGTTVVRALESASSANGELAKLSGPTQLFIREAYKFKFIDGMATNFHVPKSSLIMLVSAFVGRKQLLGLYQYAISQRLRLFSFGDGMLVL